MADSESNTPLPQRSLRSPDLARAAARAATVAVLGLLPPLLLLMTLVGSFRSATLASMLTDFLSLSAVTPGPTCTSAAVAIPSANTTIPVAMKYRIFPPA